LFLGEFTLGLIGHALIRYAGNGTKTSFPASPDNQASRCSSVSMTGNRVWISCANSLGSSAPCQPSGRAHLSFCTQSLDLGPVRNQAPPLSIQATTTLPSFRIEPDRADRVAARKSMPSFRCATASCQPGVQLFHPDLRDTQYESDESERVVSASHQQLQDRNFHKKMIVLYIIHRYKCFSCGGLLIPDWCRYSFGDPSTANQ
jgi:hypothetical protein